MWKNLLFAGVALSALALAGCKCCNPSSRCDSPALVNMQPIQPGCNNCGGTPPPGVVVPGGPGGPGPVQQPGAYYPPGPFSPSNGPKI
jgi:hypothetical protein